MDQKDVERDLRGGIEQDDANPRVHQLQGLHHLDQGNIIENPNLTGFQKLLLSTQKAIEKVTSSKAFQDVKRFIFGSEKIPVYNDNFEVAFYKQDFPSL